MPRRSLGADEPSTSAKRGLAERLAAELKAGRESGQPLIYEREFRTGKLRVIVIWDDWAGLALPARTATILRGYEIAEGAEGRDRVALASGLTMPEAREAGMLPYEIIPVTRRGDPVTEEQAQEALLEEGGTRLAPGPRRKARLWCATEAEAEAARARLIRRIPGTEEVWVINREAGGDEYAGIRDEALAEDD